MRRLCAVLVGLAVLHCADVADEGRLRWLQGALVEDNRTWFQRDPAQAAAKMRKMAASPYAYFRGTLGVFLRDAARPGPGFLPTAYGSGPASRVLALGDPHVENYGSFRHADGHLSVEVNDFDGASYGPYHLDVRRLALGVWLAGHEIGLRAEAQAEFARAAVDGYVAEIADQRAGAPPIDVRPGAGVVVDDLLRRAARDGDAREALDEYTVVDATGRHLALGVLEAGPTAGVVGDALVAPTTRERALVAAILAAYPATVLTPRPAAAWTLKGVARRLGAGVSSYPAVRFYALVEGPTAAVDDDWLLEIKALPTQANYPGHAPWPARPFADDAARAVRVQRTWQSTNEADPLLGWASVPPMTFRVRHRTKYQKGVSVARLAEKYGEGRWAFADLTAFAATAGRLLARGRARARTLRGEDGLVAVAEAIGADGAGFVAETMSFLVGPEGYGPRTLADFALFQQLVAADPHLGYRPARDLGGLPPRPQEPVQ